MKTVIDKIVKGEVKFTSTVTGEQRFSLRRFGQRGKVVLEVESRLVDWDQQHLSVRHEENGEHITGNDCRFALCPITDGTSLSFTPIGGEKLFDGVFDQIVVRRANVTV